MYTKAIIVIALALVGSITAAVTPIEGNGGVLVPGACPCGVNVEPDFDVSAYLGTWYEYAKYPIYFETGGKCITAQYSLQDDGNVAVNNSMIQNGVFTDILGTASIVSDAKLLVKFPVSPAYDVSSNYWVLDTDYTSYSVVYSCQNVGDQHSLIVWILTRERQPSVELIYNAARVLVRNDVALDQLVITDQSDCQ